MNYKWIYLSGLSKSESCTEIRRMKKLSRQLLNFTAVLHNDGSSFLSQELSIVRRCAWKQSTRESWSKAASSKSDQFFRCDTAFLTICENVIVRQYLAVLNRVQCGWHFYTRSPVVAGMADSWRQYNLLGGQCPRNKLAVGWQAWFPSLRRETQHAIFTFMTFK